MFQLCFTTCSFSHYRTDIFTPCLLMSLIQTKSGWVFYDVNTNQIEFGFLMILTPTKAFKFYCLYDSLTQQGLRAYIRAFAILPDGWLVQRLPSTNHARQATVLLYQRKQQQSAISCLFIDQFLNTKIIMKKIKLNQKKKKALYKDRSLCRFPNCF